ncbi:MAG: 2-oxo acid dehydrogenase subunit E2 [Opitutaceae bacterium]|jgi:pyruvate dehydrogenase E2 component (dihydrolipoamide acetyltransferase)
MPTITLPQTKEMPKGTIRRWRKKAGQAVSKGEVIVEVEGETSLVEIESSVSGTLVEILAPEGETVSANGPLAVVNPDQASAAPPPAKPAPSPAAPAEALRAKAGGTVIPIVMPKAGQSMEEGVLAKWLVAPGAQIKKGDVIFEIETDKAKMEVEATDSGRLSRIVLPDGGTIAVLQPVAYLADNDADVDTFIASQGGAAAASAPSPAVSRDAGAPAASAALPANPAVVENGRAKASPAARKIAGARGIDLTRLPAGSGPGGRIISTDVPLTASAARPSAPVAPGGTRRKMSQMAKAIARNLSLSKQTIPHFYERLTINAEPLFAFYQGEKAKYPVTLNDVVVLGCARAIMEFPAFRSQLAGDEVIEFPTANIGVAVAMDDGLVVPVLASAERMSLAAISVETKRIAAAARAGKIEGMGTGVFTITNLGMFGVEEFAAIINPPESAILAIGAAREAVVVKDGAMRAGRVMTMTLSADHRLINGALAAKFLARLKELLEAPAALA